MPYTEIAMGASRSYNFQSFEESYFGDPYMAWHDGLDSDALAALEGEEREEAERMLLAALGNGDYRPAAGLKVLESRKASAPLKTRLKEVSGREAVEVALALWNMEKYEPAMRAIIDVLQDGQHWGERIDAAIALRYVLVPDAEEALWRALGNDPENLVRYHASDSLLVRHGLSPETEVNGNRLSVEVMMEDVDRRNRAIAGLRKAIAEAGQGGEQGGRL